MMYGNLIVGITISRGSLVFSQSRVKVSASLTNVGSLAFYGPDLQHHRLTNTIHLTLKMTSAQVVETSVTNNSSFQNYPRPDDHTIRTTDTPGFKPFSKVSVLVISIRPKGKYNLGAC